MKKQNGITLISLIITIIVMLILAGVALSMIMGENSVLDQATTAVDETENSEEIEKTELAVLGAFGVNGKYDSNKAFEGIKKNYNLINTITTTTDSGANIVTGINSKTGENIILTHNSDGSIIVETEDYILAFDGRGKVTEKNKLNGTLAGGGNVNEPILPEVPTDPALSPNGNVPEGSYYANLSTGQFYTEMPSVPSDGDVYLNGDYVYFYESGNQYWSVTLATADLGISAYIPDFQIQTKDKSSYGTILENINNVRVGSLRNTFADCTDLTSSPSIPSGVTDLAGAFSNCSSLLTIPKLPAGLLDLEGTFYECKSLTDLSNVVIPDSVLCMNSTFSGCTSLTQAPKTPASVTEMYGTYRECSSLKNMPNMDEATKLTDMSVTFYDCISLVSATSIPSSVQDMDSTFFNCTSLINAPDMKNAINVTTMSQAFRGCAALINPPDLSNLTKLNILDSAFCDCSSLKNPPVIPASATRIEFMFSGCESMISAPIIPEGITDMDGVFGSCKSLTTAPIIPNTVTMMWNTFRNCTSLTTAPIIPESVKDIRLTFAGCTSLKGDVQIDATPIQDNIGYYASCFEGVDMSKITITGKCNSTIKRFIANTGRNSDLVTIK